MSNSVSRGRPTRTVPAAVSGHGGGALFVRIDRTSWGILMLLSRNQGAGGEHGSGQAGSRFHDDQPPAKAPWRASIRAMTCSRAASTRRCRASSMSPRRRPWARVLLHTPGMVLKADRAGRLPLHYAALEGRTADVAAYLEEDPDAVNLADSAGFTALHFAAQGQHAEAARVLIEAGALVSARNRFGATALWVALMNVRDGHGAVIRVLLDAGADPDAENNSGISARSLAAKVDNYDLMRFFRN